MNNNIENIKKSIDDITLTDIKNIIEEGGEDISSTRVLEKIKDIIFIADKKIIKLIRGY